MNVQVFQKCLLSYHSSTPTPLLNLLLVPGKIMLNEFCGNQVRITLTLYFYLTHISYYTCYMRSENLLKICKGTFLSESTYLFVITPNRPTFFFPETENLNFGDKVAWKLRMS